MQLNDDGESPLDKCDEGTLMRNYLEAKVCAMPSSLTYVRRHTAHTEAPHIPKLFCYGLVLSASLWLSIMLVTVMTATRYLL